MAQNQNQFSQSPIQGQSDLRFNGQTISGQIDASSAGGLIPGQAVKMVDSAGGIPKLVECSAVSDDVFGFINYDLKKDTYAAGDKVEISCMHGNVMYMTSSAAIARNAKLMLVISGSKVATAAGSGTVVVGRALDKATGANQVIRVIIDLPGIALP